MDKAAFRAKFRRTREKDVALEEGKSVTLVRPPEAELGDMLKPHPTDADKRIWSIELEHVRKYTVGWKGITEADFFGKAVGSDDPVEFDQDLWMDLVSDNVDWMNKVTGAILAAIVEHHQQTAEVAKNSEPG